MEVLLKRSTRVVLAMVLAAMMMLLLASEAMAKPGVKEPQPVRPPGNPDSGITTGRINRGIGNSGGPDDKGPSQAVVAPSLIQQT